MRRFEIRIESVTGHCACGYSPGDKYYANGLNTPEKQFCGGAYMVLFPMQNALAAGAAFDFEKNPKSKTKPACPDCGCVKFSITLLE